MATAVRYIAMNASNTEHRSLLRQHMLEEITLLALMLLVYLGVAWTDVSPAGSQLYWYLMVPVFLVAALISEWPNIRARGRTMGAVIGYQLWQWLAVLASVKMVFVIQQLGRLNNETTGLILLLLFALTAFITGLRLGWLFRLAGLFMAFSLLLLAYTERFLWILLLLGGLMLLFHHLLHRHHRHQRESA